MALPAVIANRLGESAYGKRIARGLTRAYSRAGSTTIDLKDLKAVIFSDHHRGQGDRADDFARCEPAYCAALGWYAQQGFGLWLLGDVEELWENRPRQVMDRYANVLSLEREFGPRLWRFFGNHDMAWRRKKNVTKFLSRTAEVREGLKITVTDDGKPLGTIFLVHGHQGTIDSGNLLVVPFSRFVVRFFWAALQRAQGFASTSPATDAKLRGKHDRAMAAWAKAHPERLLLVAGHTHRPAFPGTLPPDLDAENAAREAAYQEAKKSGRNVSAARAERELARVRAAREEADEPVGHEATHYLNTGCCSYGDGDITGLELADGKVRLVRWLANDGDAAPRELACADLSTMLSALSGSVPDLPGT